ncbi:hypothetical protein OQH60_06650 [Campylobacter sp. MIT 21-1685]|uniref:hypothetical protein n=1 Tax=unclassified Campylobacter TaxID=2593542 RepID=UPI00224A9E9A|nr:MULTISPECIES: hypothetical protein [unclassified Campylobacter]MCX2683543.1 hypothetical protein [Campylobacter sp. MIT 21-1684]MCX2751796.1 hypothetical protein [Campylobacter sp. MIT 21-1682]MCX2808027.1 hypothetical protein [Campylobacter sp. MIT 21-1685]
MKRIHSTTGKFIANLLFFTSLAFASNENVSNNIIDSASEGRKVIEEQELSPAQINKNKEEEKYRRAVILNWILAYEKKNERGEEFTGTKVKDTFVQNIKTESKNNGNNATETKKLVAVKGFCFIMNEINAGIQPTSIRIPCQTNRGSIILMANLIAVNEKLSLMADPKYIERNTIRFKVQSAIVLNEEKTSYNLATFVNDRKIEQMSWDSLASSSQELKNSTNEYLKALQESKKKQEVNYITASDGINIVADIVKSTAEVFRKDLPYLYQIVPKTKIWIDLEVENEGILVR